MAKQTDWLGDDRVGKTPEQLKMIEQAVDEIEQSHDLQLREYPVEVLLHKYNDGKEQDDAEIFIPYYQREFIWAPKQQSRFIESLFMGLPIPPLFLGFTDEEDHAGAMEVIDGTQRLRTLDYFLSSKLQICGLKKIPELNGFVFSEIPRKLQRIFKAKAIRVAILNVHLDEESRREMFDRLNSGGTKLQPMEVRRGKSDGLFLNLIEELAKDTKFRNLCPLPTKKIYLREYEEMVLRFFAYSLKADEFVHEVDPFLTNFLEEKNEELKQNPYQIQVYRDQFSRMLNFVEINFPNGFRKDVKHNSVPRVRFEAISVGVDWALKTDANLKLVNSVDSWLNSSEFKFHTRSDATNSKPKLFERIWFVRDSLLNNEPERYQRERARVADDEWKNLDLFS